MKSTKVTKPDSPKPEDEAADKEWTMFLTRPAHETQDQALARHALRPSARAAITIKNVDRKDTHRPTLSDLTDQLAKQCDNAAHGDLSRGEAMLVAQAHTLDALFNSLVLRAMANSGRDFSVAESLYRLAFRAQSQSRAAWETLSAMRNPPNVAFVKQANIGQAVQVNNGTPPEPRARENEIAPNKLLEHSDGERLDLGATATSSRTDSALETVGAIYGTQNKSG